MENQDMPSADAETEVSSEKAQATQVMTKIREQMMDSNKLREEQLEKCR